MLKKHSVRFEVTNVTLEDFRKVHPWPRDSDDSSLFRFMPFNLEDPEFIEHLFLQKKLYHSLSKDFNDPFDGKPHFNIEDEESDPQVIRKHLVKIFRGRDQSKKEAEKTASNLMKNPNNFINTSASKTFEKVRVCCFTTDKENVLFWSHYAKSHTGVCIEFDASAMPISMAYKIEYSDQYPKFAYPVPPGELAFRPLLVKAKAWEYENEFRTIFWTDTGVLPHDGTSLFLNASAITNVYLGADMDSKNRDLFLKIISDSEFNPNIWQATLSHNSFELDFTQCAI